MVGNHALTAEGPGFIPGWVTKIPQTMRQKKKNGNSVDEKRHHLESVSRACGERLLDDLQALNPRTRVLTRREEHRGDSQVKTEAGITALCLQAKGGQQPPKAKRKA